MPEPQLVTTGLARSIPAPRNLAKLFGRQKGLVGGIEQIGEGQVVRAGNMAAPPARPEFRLAGVEAAGGSGVQHLLTLGLDIGQHLRLVADLAVIEARR